MKSAAFFFTVCVLATFFVCKAKVPLSFENASVGDTSWEHYGGDLRGQRYSPLNQITRANIQNLKPAWEFSTGSLKLFKSTPRFQSKKMAFEATPLLADRTLFVCDPFDVVFAINPKSGQRLWKYDPHVSGKVAYDHVCRGVATWKSARAESSCERRIYVGTTDARLIAIDAKTGQACRDFGRQGVVDLTQGLGDLHPGEYYMTSPPTVVNDVVVTGALVADNWREDAPSGVIRAFNARTGALVWAWDASPPGYVRPAHESGDFARGTPNSWSIFTADPALDLIYIPTGNPALDLYGGVRKGLDFYGSSVVALKVSSGQVAWHFQTVHHDLWDYDVASQPSLFTYVRNGAKIPALAQATKVGHVFILDRRNGQPILPVVERPVPQSRLRGETSSATQPFPVAPAPLYPYDPKNPHKTDEVFNGPLCAGVLHKGLRWDGVFTPPSAEGSITFPGPVGGTDWGGVAVDERHQIVVVNQSSLPMVNKLVTRSKGPAKFQEIAAESLGDFALKGAPYFAHRSTLTNLVGVPCFPTPAGELIAINLQDGSVRWRVPLGETLRLKTGSVNSGGPLITGGNLVFIGAALDDAEFHHRGHLRAFDLATGALAWKADLPTQASATPMTYMIDGEQYVVVYAGGHGVMSAKMDDRLIAFKLAR